MKLEINEIIGLNSMLDGENIWGFPETLDKSETDYVKKTAEQLMSHGRKQVDYLLHMLEQYKKSGSYIMINQINAARTEDGWVILAKEGDGYHLLGMEHEILYDTLKKEIEIFRDRDEEITDTEPEKTDFIELVRKQYEQIGRCVFFCKYEKWQRKEFHIIYELNGKRNIYDLEAKENRHGGNKQTDELIRRYTDKWELKKVGKVR